MDLFWGNRGRKGRHSLQNAISILRKGLAEFAQEVVIRHDDAYQLSPEFWVDVHQFRTWFLEAQQQKSAESWLRAEQALRGDLLVGLESDWVHQPRFQLAQQLCRCRVALAERATQRGDWEKAVAWWHQVLEHDSCQEVAYLGLLGCLRGQSSQVKTLYERCRQAFEQELDLPVPEQLADRFERELSGAF